MKQTELNSSIRMAVQRRGAHRRRYRTVFLMGLVLLLLIVTVGCSYGGPFQEETGESSRDVGEEAEQTSTEGDEGPILSDPATIEDVESKLTELYGLADFDIVSVTVDTVDSPEHEGSILEIIVICHTNGEETSWVESYGISYSTYLSLYQLNDSNTVYDWTDPYTELPLEAWGLILSIIEE